MKVAEDVSVSHSKAKAERRDRIIAALLWYGTWFACALIAGGMVLGMGQPAAGSVAHVFSGHQVVKAGVAFLILLPVARVVLMLMMFLRERDYAYAVIAAIVLAIIAAGVVIRL